jgi:hypothetical protein
LVQCDVGILSAKNDSPVAYQARYKKSLKSIVYYFNFFFMAFRGSHIFKKVQVLIPRLKRWCILFTILQPGIRFPVKFSTKFISLQRVEQNLSSVASALAISARSSLLLQLIGGLDFIAFLCAPPYKIWSRAQFKQQEAQAFYVRCIYLDASIIYRVEMSFNNSASKVYKVLGSIIDSEKIQFSAAHTQTDKMLLGVGERLIVSAAVPFPQWQ